MQMHTFVMVCKMNIVIGVYAENFVIFMAYLRLFIEHAGGDIASSLIMGLQSASSTSKGTIAKSVCALRILCDVGESLLHAGVRLDLDGESEMAKSSNRNCFFHLITVNHIQQGVWILTCYDFPSHTVNALIARNC